jgi:hypothetical protein
MGSKMRTVAAVGQLLLLAILGADSEAAPAGKPKAPAISPADFPSQGLAYEKALNAMFRGEFEDIAFNREDMEFSMFFRQYLASYSEKCLAALPADKV